MNRITILSVAAPVLLFIAFIIVRAESRSGNGWRSHRWHHPVPTSYLARELKLSDTQKAQIRTLWQAERPVPSGQIHKLLAENKEMDAIAANGNPDSGEVHKIADREANTIATLMVEKASLQSKIYSTVLTPDPREKAVELQKKWESRLDGFVDRFTTQPAAK